MKINWAVRFKNKTWLVAFIAMVVAFAYQILGMFGVVPTVSQDDIVQLGTLVVTILAGMGVVQDPTTTGIGDSDRALQYTEPKEHTEDSEV